MTLHRTSLRARVLLATVVALVTLFAASSAFAAPSEATMDLTELRSRLSTGTMTGYFKTVLRGSTVSTVPVEVLAVTGGPTDDLEPGSTLIYFEAKGDVIDRLGGIAAGMSGSPIYVETDDGEFLVGAVSYGDYYSLHGAGLATPIDAMTAVENQFAPTMRTLAAPTVTLDGVKDRVIITTDPQDFATQAKDGAVVASPMSALYIGGANTRSGLYKKLATRLEQQGFNLIPLSAAVSSSSERFETTFTAGSAITALVSRGDLWVGGIGTVTYVNGSNVLAFGHPLDGLGDTDFYMSNAWIDGVWPSAAFPYKMGTPGKLRGTIVEDRSTGIMGVINGGPADSLVKAHATRSDKGTSADSNVGLPKSVINSSDIWYGITPYAASIAAWKLYDEYPGAGSAVTKTTVKVTDGVDSYTIVRDNVWDSSYYIADATGYDADTITWMLQDINSAGLYDVDIESVEVTSTLTSERNAASIVDVSVDGGLRHGDNTVTVSLHQRGVIATQSWEVTMSIPATAPLTGELVASAWGYSPEDEGDSSDESDEYYDEYYYDEFYSGAGDRRTLGEVVKELNSFKPNNTIQVTFVPEEPLTDEEFDLGGLEDLPGLMPAEPQPAYGYAEVPWYIDGMASKNTDTVEMEVYPAVSSYLGYSFLYGTVKNVTTGTAEFWLQYAGETSQTLVATCDIEKDPELGLSVIYADLDGLSKNATVTVVTPGSDTVLSTRTEVPLKVAAKQSLTSSSYSVRRGQRVTLSSSILPNTVTGNVVFERLVNGKWRTLKSATTVNGKASYRFAPSTTMTIRARTSGYPTNAAGKSRTITVKVR